MRIFATLGALVVLAACQPAAPNDTFANSNDRFVEARRATAAREAELRGTQQTVPAPTTVQQQELPDLPSAQASTSTTTITPPTDETASADTQVVVANRDGSISDEQDFSAVSGRETIESDAARLQRNREQYKVITATDLPSRNGNTPNIIAYAIQTDNPVGVSLYKRTLFATQNRFLRNCQSYASQDLAQQDFLARGGPIRDRKSIDPDGDGFACQWDPRPFRAAVSN